MRRRRGNSEESVSMAKRKASGGSAATPQALISIKDLSVDFRAGGKVTHAVKHASFAINKGETVALVGESGSGKTVTALSILRLLPYPAASHPSGAILFKGEDLLALPPDALRRVRGNQISMIFQEPMTSLNPLHTIEQQVGEVLKIHRGLSDRAARARVLDLLTKVGIEDPEGRLQSYPHQLSGGQRQRVMIAMALANEPDLLIADEPTTALDVTIQAQILELLLQLKDEFNMAMMLITHDLGIVRKMADRVCVMTQGEIVEQGSTQDIFTAPKHAYTKHLLAAEPKGSPPAYDANAPTIVEAKDLRVWFPIRRGFLRRTVGYIKAVDGLDLAVKEGQTLGVVGESGSGKTTLGLRAAPAHLERGADRLSRQPHRPIRLKADAAAPPRHADRVPGPLWLALPSALGGADRRGGPHHPEAAARRGGAAGARGPGAQRGGARSRHAGPLPA